MREPKKPEVPAENPARSRDGRDENPAESKRAWEAFFDAIEKAEGATGSDEYECAEKEAA